MIDYEKINYENLQGTIKFCIKQFPEDFENIRRIELAIYMALKAKSLDLIHKLNENEFAKPHLQYLVATRFKTSLMLPLLEKGFFNNNERLPDFVINDMLRLILTSPKKKQLIRQFVKKVLLPKEYMINNYFLTTKIFKDIPLDSRKYTYRTLPHGKNLELSHIIRVFKEETRSGDVYYDNLNTFIRRCKPIVDWDKLILTIDKNDFYMIISIINSLDHYEPVKCSYEEFKTKYYTPNTYNETILQHMKDYVERNSITPQLLNEPYEPYGHISNTSTTSNISLGHNLTYTSSDSWVALPNITP